MDNTARNRVLEQIPYFSERMGRNYTQNAEYKESVKKADLIFEKQPGRYASRIVRTIFYCQ